MMTMEMAEKLQYVSSFSHFVCLFLFVRLSLKVLQQRGDKKNDNDVAVMMQGLVNLSWWQLTDGLASSSS